MSVKKKKKLAAFHNNPNLKPKYAGINAFYKVESEGQKAGLSITPSLLAGQQGAGRSRKHIIACAGLNI